MRVAVDVGPVEVVPHDIGLAAAQGWTNCTDSGRGEVAEAETW